MIAALIPARYASSRFPGKPLVNETGKYLVQHVYEKVAQAKSVDEVLIATDDQRIAQACEQFGARWQMTRNDHQNGTDRIAEAVAGIEADIIVNVQGDEPEIEPDNIDRLVEVLQQDNQADIATLAAIFGPGEDINNPNIVKVVVDKNGHALYFSRAAIPYLREKDTQPVYRKHIGIYAYRRDTLLELSRLPPSPLEQAEKLEQLRALENGMVIAVADVKHTAVGIDTPQQYAEFLQRYKNA
jgi:3-deoxy-manno-octulosonate cytidylyltransferase (CMP-KDO synthetase)